MAIRSDTKSLLVRLQPELYQAATRIAHKRGNSLNALVQQSLQELIRVEEDRELYEAATLLGMDAKGCDVEYALPAQSEALRSDEY